MSNSKRELFRKPHLTNEVVKDRERKSSWLELFFDIFFIVAVSSAGHTLAKDISAHGLEAFVIAFVAIWWVWISFVYYNEMHETFGLENRLFTILMMLPVAGMAIGSHHILKETFPIFVISYAAANLLLSLLYFRAGYHINKVKRNNYLYGIAKLITAFLAVCCLLFLNNNIAISLFILVIIFDIISPVVAFFVRDKDFFDSLQFSEKFNERLGLFSIIVIGEMIVSTIGGIGENYYNWNYIRIGLFGLLYGISFWWIYFDFVSRRGMAKSTLKRYTWTYLHLFFFTGIMALGAGFLNILHHIEHPSNAVIILIGFATGYNLILIGLIELVSFRHQFEPTNSAISFGLKCITGFLAIVVTYIFMHNFNLFLVALLAILLVNVAYSVWLMKFASFENYSTEYYG